MHREEEPSGRLGSSIEVCGPHERPSRDVHPRLLTRRLPLDGFAAGRLVQTAHVHRSEGEHALGGPVRLLPRLPVVLEAQAQRIVVAGHRAQGRLQLRGGEGLVQAQQERLVPVVPLVEVPLEEAALDGREGHAAGHLALLAGHRGPGALQGLGERGIVWCRNSSGSGTTSPCCRALTTTWMHMIESPPSSKKLSWMPTSETLSTARHTPASRDSTAVRAATFTRPVSEDSCGAGSLRVSTLPCALSGRASRKVNEAGTM